MADFGQYALDSEYHEQHNTPSILWNHRVGIQCGDTMIYTIENWKDCLPMPASARRCQTEMRVSYWICENTES